MKTEKDFTVYFELFGKKMKTTVIAESEESAKDIIKSKIVFYKIEKPNTAFNQVTDTIDNIFNELKNITK